MRIMPFFASLFASDLSKVAHKIVTNVANRPTFSPRGNNDLAAISRSSRPVFGIKLLFRIRCHTGSGRPRLNAAAAESDWPAKRKEKNM